ncbi:hypothetical protein FOPG_19688 [Fusarium oxysporum f. sp. conglutinans race 2 54008]|uniref:JmjC domain-containing protein n=1 Tax=Fusarium oxysporum f. sp. conglutinans race 2 54008 TaxID=1089457 RepID=X0GK76_FUSOX|nr:hypothetical protein FOPG_19688 [Fusarium oxysporum f. sp. conglutinans race 2 54008]KAI8416452.1 hypothetical protein FOFC_02762 [Fusarium oxysporum]
MAATKHLNADSEDVVKNRAVKNRPAKRTKVTDTGIRNATFRCLFCNQDKPTTNRARHFKSSTGCKGSADKQSSVEGFLEKSTGPQRKWANLFKKALEKAGSLSTLNNKDEDGPLIFPVEECLNEGVTDNILIDNIFHHYDQKSQKIYSDKDPDRPQKDATLAEVLQQLTHPNLANVKYAVNLGHGHSTMKPMRFSLHKTESEMITNANVTPEGTCILPHIDRGNHVVTCLGRGCQKLWLLYPPTTTNLSLWAKYRKSNKIFEDLVDHLENGEVAVQNTDEAIYLPPGYIHATYTLKGGIVFGINYATKEGLPITSKIFEIETENFLTVDKEDVTPLLESIKLRFECFEEGDEELRKALLVFDKFSKRTEVKQHQRYRRVKELANERRRGLQLASKVSGRRIT